MNNKHLNVGVYESTESFREIEKHSCVCFDDMTLVATTGPAEDKESQSYADLFAASPELLAVLELAVRYLEHPDVLEITRNMALSGEAVVSRIHSAISQAKGVTS